MGGSLGLLGVIFGGIIFVFAFVVAAAMFTYLRNLISEFPIVGYVLAILLIIAAMTDVLNTIIKIIVAIILLVAIYLFIKGVYL